MTRAQYIERSKERALRVGPIREAVVLMIIDMRKHPNCEVPHEIHAIALTDETAGPAEWLKPYIPQEKRRAPQASRPKIRAESVQLEAGI